MTLSEFKQLWDWAESRGKFQQEYSELEHVYDLMKACECQSYLEIGSAEGNSLYILAHAAKKSSFIDYGEAHTFTARKSVTDFLTEKGKPPFQYIGDSTNPYLLPKDYQYDCILIDGGHDFATVLSDSILYAPLATKYVFWHDIQLPEVKAAVEWFVKRWKLGKYSTFINSDTYGYGILEINK